MQINKSRKTFRITDFQLIQNNISGYLNVLYKKICLNKC